MAKLLMRTGTPSWRTRTPTCRSLAEESLSQRRCIISCDSTAETDFTPGIYRVILLRTAVSACQSGTPLRFLMPCKSGLLSLCSAERRSTVTTQVNRSSEVFRAVHVLAHSWARAFRLGRPLLGGGGKIVPPLQPRLCGPSSNHIFATSSNRPKAGGYRKSSAIEPVTDVDRTA